jgi:hypothetical protein
MEEIHNRVLKAEEQHGSPRVFPLVCLLKLFQIALETSDLIARAFPLRHQDNIIFIFRFNAVPGKEIH